MKPSLKQNDPLFTLNPKHAGHSGPHILWGAADGPVGDWDLHRHRRPDASQQSGSATTSSRRSRGSGAHAASCTCADGGTARGRGSRAPPAEAAADAEQQRYRFTGEARVMELRCWQTGPRAPCLASTAGVGTGWGVAGGSHGRRHVLAKAASINSSVPAFSTVSNRSGDDADPPAATTATPYDQQQQQPSNGAPLPPQLGTHSFRMLVSYDGTAYSGWQLQPHAPTVQQHVEHALGTVLREPREALGVRAAGRTDAGVHAAGQVVQFCTSSPEKLQPGKLPLKLNSLLPHDIRVTWVGQTAADFNVTCSAIGKVGWGGLGG